MPAVNYRLDGNVAVLEVDNPPVNAASIHVREGLGKALKQAASDPKVKALVLTGANGMFLADADITDISRSYWTRFLPFAIWKRRLRQSRSRWSPRYTGWRWGAVSNWL